MTSVAVIAWTSFVEVSKIFPGNHKSSKYTELVREFRTLKMYHVDQSAQSPQSSWPIREEQGEQFHQYHGSKVPKPLV